MNAWTAAQATSLGAFTSQGTSLPGSDLELRYTYDYADRRIRRSIDTDGAAGASAESVSFAAYAGDARTLEIARTDTFPIGFLGQVIQRNFYGNGADEILAVDKIAWNGTTPTTSTFWTFTDHQDTVRDIISGNATDRGQVVEHRQYDSFGTIVRRTTGPQATAPATAGLDIDFGYAGRPLESSTGLSDNRARWYEPGTGRFINEDPRGFKGGDANLYRYVGNDPLDQVDPSGLTGIWANAVKPSVTAAAWPGFGWQTPITPATTPSTSAMAFASLMSQPVAATPTYSPSSASASMSPGFTAVSFGIGTAVEEAGYRVLRANPILEKHWVTFRSSSNNNPYKARGGFTVQFETFVNQASNGQIFLDPDVRPVAVGSTTVFSGKREYINGSAARDALAREYLAQRFDVKTEQWRLNCTRQVDVVVHMPNSDPRYSVVREIEVKAHRVGIGDSNVKRQILNDALQLAQNQHIRGSARAAGLVGKALKPVGVLLDAAELRDAYVADGNQVGTETKRTAVGIVGGSAGGALGGWGGVAAGALAGSWFPGPGTAVGAVVGGLIGGGGGGWLGSWGARAAYDRYGR